jgi:putative pyruvate formate lyase activating enzyme
MPNPIYLDSYQSGLLTKKADYAYSLLESCSICPRNCRLNRLKNEKGVCKIGLLPKVFSYMPHHGEEPPISGSNGSGTIFFSGCNMNCLYCQNYEFSQLGEGREVELRELADFMIRLQDLGCHNINLVTPTHIMPQFLKALSLAIEKGLAIPIVYNTSGYELSEMIKILDGVVDIYLADMRYSRNETGMKYSFIQNYPDFNQDAIRQMHRQVGIAKINKAGIMERGLVIRHLVLPEDSSGTEEIMKFIATEISPDTYISLMSQYLPCYKANESKELSRRISYEEYQRAKEIVKRYGLSNGWIQESRGLDRFAGTNIKKSL